MSKKILTLSCFLLAGLAVFATKIINVTTVTNRIICLHFDDGYVQYHKFGQQMQADSAIYWGTRFDSISGRQPENYKLFFNKGKSIQSPLSVSMKGKTVNFPGKYPTPAFVMEYWVYLELPDGLKSGNTYTIKATNAGKEYIFNFNYDDTKTRCDAFKINQIGYLPQAGMKYAYLYQWMGTQGSVNYSDLAGKKFHLLNTTTNKKAFTGSIAFRKTKEPENKDKRYFTQSDIWECDFSSFNKPGTYKIQIEGIGVSYPFRINSDVYNSLFYTSARGFYHQRSGLERDMPYSQFPKPADHIPGLNGFKVFYSNFRHMDQGYWGDSLKTDGQNAGFTLLPQMATNIEMPKAYGGWYDAGDWDRHLEHLVAANMMLTMFEVAPTKFYDGQLTIPESGNGLPDLLDEAKFEIDFFLFHMRGPTGGVSGWLETSAHPDNSTNAATDVFKTWYQSAEEPVASFYTSASAAQLAHCFNLIHKKDSAQKYLDEAIILYNWAQQESAKHPGELGRSSGNERRMMASAWLYRMTSRREYLEQFKEDYIRQIAGSKQKTISSIEQEMAILPFLMMKPAESERALHTSVLQQYKEYTDSIFLKTASDRACRWASDYNLPVVVGWQASTPQAFSLFMTNYLTGEQKYLDYGITTCDYFQGGNAANLVWVTGIGENALNDIFVIESWKDELEAPIPGIVPYGIIDIDMVGKQWGDAGWWNPSLYYLSCYPQVKDWPVGELEFDSRYAPMIHEFTIWQNMNYLVAASAFLCSDNITADIAEPTIPTTLMLERLSDTRFKLSWKASDDNSSQIASYQIYKDKIMVGVTTATEFVFENRLPGEASFFTVRAVDNSGNMSQHSNKCKLN